MFGWTKHEPTYKMLQWTAFFGIKMYKLSTLMDMCWHTNMNREFSINETFEFLKREIKKKKNYFCGLRLPYTSRIPNKLKPFKII